MSSLLAAGGRMAGGGTPEEGPLGDTQGRGAPGTCSPPLNPRSISSSSPRGNSGRAYVVVSLVRAESSLILLSHPKLKHLCLLPGGPMFWLIQAAVTKGIPRAAVWAHAEAGTPYSSAGEASPPGSQVGAFLVCTSANSNQPVSFSRFDFNPTTIKPSRKLQTS